MTYSTSIRYFASVLTFLEQRGIAQDKSLEAIDFTEFSDYVEPQRVALMHYSNLLDFGKQACRDPLFGCYLGADIHNADYGVLGFLIESCENLGSAINDLLKFDRLVANIGTSSFSHNLEHATIAWTPHTHCSEQVVLRNMAAWITTASQLLGYRLSPISVSFTYPYSSDQLNELGAHFSCPVFGNAKTNKIDFPFDLLHVEFRNDNPQIHQALKALSQEQLNKLNHGEKIKNRVADLLSTKVDLTNCTLIRFAAAFSVSPRTLQRQLQDEQQTFGALLDQERQRRVVAHIGKMPLGDLALQLGFKEQSSLNRAFRRWFNCTPKQYLQQQQTNSSSN